MSSQPKVYCKAFKDNSGALELARLPKIRPWTKHINIKYHHFREYVHLGLIEMLPISTTEQVADISPPEKGSVALLEWFMHHSSGLHNNISIISKIQTQFTRNLHASRIQKNIYHARYQWSSP
jgi:hypothetical protein